MLKTRLIAFCSIFFLTSGLISCSPDKEVKLVNDEMKAGPISAQNVDRRFQFGQDIKSLNLADELKLEVNGVDFNKETIYFSVDTLCSDIQTKGNYRKEFKQTNSGTFPVLKLIPEDVLLLTQENKVICNFTLTAKNSNTSTTTSQLNNVDLLHSNDYGNWENELTSEDVVFDQMKNLVLSPMSSHRHVRLNCDEFSTLLDASQNEITLESLVGENAQLPLRLTTPSQNCRALIRQGDDILLTKKFVLKMPFLPLVTTASIVDDLPLSEPIFEREVLQIHFQNPNGFPVKIKMVNPNGTSFQFQFLVNTNYGTTPVPLETRSLRWSWLNPSLADAEGNFEITLPPLQETVIKGTVDMNIHCPNYYAIIGGHRNDRSTHGIAMGFDLQTQFILTSYTDTPSPIVLDIQAPWKGSSPLTPLTLWDIQYNKVSKATARAAGHQPPAELAPQQVVERLQLLSVYCQALYR